MPSENDIVLSVKNVSKCFEMYEKPVHRLYQTLCAGKKRFYKEFWALRDISFEVRKGECVGIIGRNGAGKSTLLQIITGTLAPTTGEVKLKGRVAALLELGSGFNPEFTGKENVYLNGSILGLSKAEIDARYQDILDFADIGEFIDQPVKTYSSGMMVRLAFAVNAFVDPDVLIVDEALAVGDISFQLKCFRKMREFIDSKEKVVLFVTHDMGCVRNFCDWVYWLDRGRVKDAGPALGIVDAFTDDVVRETRAAVPCVETAVSDRSGAATHELWAITGQESFSGSLNGGRITHAGFFDDQGRRISILKKPQKVHVVFRFVAERDLGPLRCTFHLMDRRGLDLLGCSNSVLDAPCGPVKSGETAEVEFTFTIPELQNDEYVIMVSLNEGDIQVCERLHNVVDAIKFRFDSASLLQRQDVLVKASDCRFSWRRGG